MSEIVIYKDSNNQIEPKFSLKEKTVWLTQAQMVTLFDSSRTNISEYITNILESGELDEKLTVRKFRSSTGRQTLGKQGFNSL